MKCPDCGGDTWDNRPKKASGEYSPKAPDFKCKSKECNRAVWLDSLSADEAPDAPLPTADELNGPEPDFLQGYQGGAGPGKPPAQKFPPNEFKHAIDDALQLRNYAHKQGVHPTDDAVAAWATSIFIQRMRG